MTSPLRRRIRHTRRVLGYGALVALILLATMVGALNQLLPLVERNPARVAAWLADRVGEPVSFDRAVGEWTARGPRFTLDGLRIGTGERTLDIGQAELLVAVYSGLLPGEPLTELKVRDLSLVLEQGEDRRWRLAGLPFDEKPGADPLDTLGRLGELQVEHAQLAIRAPALKVHFDLPRVDLRLRVDGDRLRAGVRAWARLDGAPMGAVADLRRGDWSGDLWAGGKDLRMEHWSPLLAGSGLVVAGSGRVDLWARIDAQRVVDVRSEASFAPLALVAVDPWRADDQGTMTSPPVAFESAGVLARWQVDDDGRGWQLHAPRLRFRQSGQAEDGQLDGVWAAGGDTFALQAQRIDLAPARALATLSRAVPAGLRRWLHDAAPDGEIRSLAVAGRQGAWSGAGRFADTGWSAHGGSPGLQGLGGAASFDEDGGVIALDPGITRFEWSGFRQPLDVRLGGTLGWWRDGDGWTAGAAGLRVRGQGFGTTLRAELQFQGNGSKPRLDLAAVVEPARVPTAGRFWVVGRMPGATIDWLDGALQDGEVVDGRAVLAGDLDAWPFRGGTGRFDARARVRGATVEFHEEWPAAEALDLDVWFDGPGMGLDGSGTILGNVVQHVEGAIPDFAAPVLSLAIDSPAESAALRRLLLGSPLRETFEEHLVRATVEGPAQVAIDLVLPLAARLGPNRIDGTLELLGAHLVDPRWDLDFTEVRGTTKFSQDGFAAESLAVAVDGEPAQFTLKVGAPYTGDPALVAVARLHGELPPGTLLAHHEPLLWLGDWLAGKSAWSVGVDIPATVRGRASLPSRLHVESDLVGTTVSLPAPLAKDAATSMPLRLDAPLPLKDGEVVLTLDGKLMSMRAKAGTGDAMAGRIRFGEANGQGALPAQGFVVGGRVATLDAAGWIGFAAKGGSDVASPSPTQVAPAGPTGAGLAPDPGPGAAAGPRPAPSPAASPPGTDALREVDLQVDTLDLLGSTFADARVQLRRAAAVTRVLIDAEAIAGSVEIPRELSAGVTGRFSRLFWPEKPAPSPEQLAEAATGRSDDPSKLPPLRFDVDDLRVGTLALGKTQLVATPLPAGLRIERFTTRSPTLELLATGDWLVAGAGHSQSRFEVDFRANSLGELLAAFGLEGMVDDGETRGRLDGRWPGSPGAFSLARFEGTLSADVGEGALLDVEPGGGGRMLGLISLAEIPRRLTLDFSDFFEKGFGFNTMSGEFVFADGRATTDLLLINGPAAEIRVSGATDLRKQEYDQRIEVLPKAGGVLPAIGLVAGGPVGAAVGAVAQAVLQKPLKEAARTVYSVTGSWKKPDVVVVEKGPPKLETGN